MDSFSFMGYCKTIELYSKPTSAEIYDAVMAAFSPAYPMENWRLLFRQGKGRGTDGVLRLSPANSKFLTLANIEQ